MSVSTTSTTEYLSIVKSPKTNKQDKKIKRAVALVKQYYDLIGLHYALGNYKNYKL